MRLTLRTLLSYLDNVLDEPARGELREQIESNEHATEWVHRTRDVMRRLRLGAPEIEGTGSIDDPNTVAEYLDRTLPEESVADFERVCLESDEMLAEVASCHHVLAMFLERPADVDPDTRKRLVRLQDDLANAMRARIEQAHSPPGGEVPTPEASSVVVASAGVQPVEQPAAAPPRREKAPKAPDYLRESSGSELMRWAPAIAALALLAITAALAFRPGGWLRPAAVAVADPEATDPAASSEPAATTPEPSVDQPSVEEPSVDGASGDEPAGEEPANNQPAVDPAPVDPAPASDEPASGATDGPAEAADPPPAAVEPTQGGEPSPSEIEPPPGSEPTDAPSEVAGPAGPPTYVGPESAVLVSRSEAGSWLRVRPESALGAEARLASLPTYRPSLRWGGSVTMELVGLSEVVLRPPSEASPNGEIEVSHARLVFRHDEAAEEPVAVALRIDDAPYTAILSPGAVLALQVDRPFEPGVPLTERSPSLVAVAESFSGSVEWSGGGMTAQFAQPRRWPVAGNDVFGPFGWVTQLELSSPDQLAGPELSESLMPDAPIGPQLRDVLSKEVFREVRALAARSALELGDPEPIAASFGDRDQSAAWRGNLEELRQVACRSSADAQRIEAAFAEAYESRETAGELMRLLSGFDRGRVGTSPERVSEGVVAEVILPGLESKELAVRVLAGLALEETVEPLERPFSPLAPPNRRNSSIRKLRQLLEEKSLNPLGP